MGQLSQRNAKVIARQICAEWNKKAKEENQRVEAQRLFNAFLTEDWQAILKALSLEATGFEDLPYFVKEVFKGFILPRFAHPKMSIMQFEDALRLVEYKALYGYAGADLEKEVLKAWKDEQY